MTDNPMLTPTIILIHAPPTRIHTRLYEIAEPAALHPLLRSPAFGENALQQAHPLAIRLGAGRWEGRGRRLGGRVVSGMRSVNEWLFLCLGA